MRWRISLREAMVPDTGKRCCHLRQQRVASQAKRFLYKGKLRNLIYLIIQWTEYHCYLLIIVSVLYSQGQQSDETGSVEQFVRLGQILGIAL